MEQVTLEAVNAYIEANTQEKRTCHDTAEDMGQMSIADIRRMVKSALEYNAGIKASNKEEEEVHFSFSRIYCGPGNDWEPTTIEAGKDWLFVYPSCCAFPVGFGW